MEENKKNKVPNVPNLRFSDDTWQMAKIGDVLTIERGGSPRPIQYFVTRRLDGINWIKIGDTSDDGYIYSAKEKIIPEGAKHSRKVNAGDLLLSNSMSFGKPYILKINGCIHDGWLVIRDIDSKFNKEFLRNYLGSSFCISQYKKLAAGGVVTNLNKDLVCSAIIKYPPISSQEKIATFLCLLDERIRTQNKIICGLKSLKFSLSHFFFKSFDSYSKLGDVAKIVKGEQINGEFLNDKSAYPVYNGGINASGYYNKYNSENCITISEGGNSCGTVRFIKEKFWSGGHNYAIICKDNVFDQFLYYCLKYNENRIMSLRVGSGLPNIQKSSLNDFKINITSIIQQREIATRLSVIDSKISNEKKLFELYKKQKVFLLNNLFI